QPSPRQTLLFSATMPREIMHLADAMLHNPVKVAVAPVASAAPLIEQKVYHVPRIKKLPLLVHLLEQGEEVRHPYAPEKTLPVPAGTERFERVLVFTKTKHGADRLARQLRAQGVGCDAIHGNKGQNQRQRALAAFRDGAARVL